MDATSKAGAARKNEGKRNGTHHSRHCLLYTSDAADERSSVDLGGRRIIKKKTVEGSGGAEERATITTNEQDQEPHK